MEYETQEEWMKVCVPKMMDEGKDNEQAVGACMGMWANKADAQKYKALTIAAVKAVPGDDGEYVLEILGAPFGGPINGRDKDGERFTQLSNLHIEEFPEIPLVLTHGLDPHTGKPVGKPLYVGKAKYLRQDARGHWWRGVLDKTKSVAKGLWEAAKSGMLGASSGSLSHLVRIAKDGTILEWPVAEMTLADLNGNVHPINSYAVATPMIKATYREAGLPFPDKKNFRDDLQDAKKAVEDAKITKLRKESEEVLKKFDNRRQ